MKIKNAFLPVLLLGLLALPPAAPADQEFISIATGGTAGTYYPIGGAIAKAVTDGSDLKVTAETGHASVANINQVSKGDRAVAFAQNDTAYWAYNGQEMFKEPRQNLRSVAALFPEHVQLIVAKEAGIKAMADLKGKRVSVGAPGSGVEADVQAIFKVAGLKYDDMKVDHLDFGATTNRFKDNQIDAGFVVAGYPTASIMDLANTKAVSLVSFDAEFMSALAKAHPYFVPDAIPGGSYPGMNEETSTPAVMAMLITHENVPEDVIYKFTKALFENLPTVQAAHAKAKEITLATALTGLTAPLHPGAAKYYKEKGLKVPE
jgi:TRAP transporter TAXI family solute receptor